LKWADCREGRRLYRHGVGAYHSLTPPQFHDLARQLQHLPAAVAADCQFEPAFRMENKDYVF
jgi:hypothetical protein